MLGVQKIRTALDTQTSRSSNPVQARSSLLLRIPRAIERIRPARIGRMRPGDDAKAGWITSRNLRAGGLVQSMVMIPLGADGPLFAPD